MWWRRGRCHGFVLMPLGLARILTDRCIHGSIVSLLHSFVGHLLVGPRQCLHICLHRMAVVGQYE